ncbi:uncharacterized protein M421DRAFT_502 [Didymella exigua CBS 183.55]|uniref:Uncharacterized protein n=1 Tax=Didymella exigua CBS 183.55 TaxID=1150837 RepID=A0A6A5S362_9PLEO|nr:uncharacterized protein M421DRAFT_502 [Didymella exigua CBS 183.55]KAF1934373.1 hypothetical protein M421DRAFT_502 [Didymella exigua CBS 183.55]
MPYMKFSASKVADLSWDSFAAPTPGAEEWQPDPDSVPIAGGLPNPRFNKSPLTQQQKQALKRDKLLSLYLDRPSKNPHHPLFSPPDPVKPVDMASVAPVRSSAPTVRAATTSKPTNGNKGTMETLPAQPLFQRPHTPPTSVASQVSELPVRTSTPVWFRTIEHLLGDDSPPRSTPLVQPVVAKAAALPAPVSRPPHLCKQPQAFRSSAPVATPAFSKNSVAQTDAPQVKTQPINLAEAPPPEATRHTAQELKVLKSLLESFIPKNTASPSQEHERCS